MVGIQMLRAVYVVSSVLARVRREYILLRHDCGFRKPNFVVVVYSFPWDAFRALGFRISMKGGLNYALYNPPYPWMFTAKHELEKPHVVVRACIFFRVWN